MFGFGTMERMSKQAPELLVQYKSLWDAIERRKVEIAAKDSKGQEKRRKEPSRYRCGNVSCQIMGDKGKMMARCKDNFNFCLILHSPLFSQGSGKCDVDKKPSYCGSR